MKTIAKRLGRTGAQVLLRWALQLGLAVTFHAERSARNCGISWIIQWDPIFLGKDQSWCSNPFWKKIGDLPWKIVAFIWVGNICNVLCIEAVFWYFSMECSPSKKLLEILQCFCWVVARKQHVMENLEALDFELSVTDLRLISGSWHPGVSQREDWDTDVTTTKNRYPMETLESEARDLGGAITSGGWFCFLVLVNKHFFVNFLFQLDDSKFFTWKMRKMLVQQRTILKWMLRVPEWRQGGFIQDMTTLRPFGPIMKRCFWTAGGLNCSHHAEVLTKWSTWNPYRWPPEIVPETPSTKSSSPTLSA